MLDTRANAVNVFLVHGKFVFLRILFLVFSSSGTNWHMHKSYTIWFIDNSYLLIQKIFGKSKTIEGLRLLINVQLPCEESVMNITLKNPSTMTLFLRHSSPQLETVNIMTFTHRCSSIELCNNGFIYYNIVLSLAFFITVMLGRFLYATECNRNSFLFTVDELSSAIIYQHLFMECQCSWAFELSMGFGTCK